MSDDADPDEGTRRRGWEDLIVGERMRLDQEFSDRVRASRFSSQEWSLIMTAVEFRVQGEGEAARLVAETGKIESVLPELERIRNQQPGGGGTSGGGSLLDSVKGFLGMGGGTDPETLEAATDLADEYAAALQDRLEEQGKWEQVRSRAD